MADAPQEFGPYVVTLEPAEVAAAAARHGLRKALGGGLTAGHHAPLAAFALTLLFAAILALTGLISRRAGELTFLIAGALFMMQRLWSHRRIWRARNSGRTEVERELAGAAVTTRIGPDGVTQSGAGAERCLAFADCEEAEEAGGLVYIWPRAGAPVVLPSRALAEGQATGLAKWIRERIRRARKYTPH